MGRKNTLGKVSDGKKQRSSVLRCLAMELQVVFACQKKVKCSIHSMHSTEKLNQIRYSSLQMTDFILAYV